MPPGAIPAIASSKAGITWTLKKQATPLDSIYQASIPNDNTNGRKLFISYLILIGSITSNKYEIGHLLGSNLEFEKLFFITLHVNEAESYNRYKV